MNAWLTLGTACTLGFLHALELDHMVAVSAFVSRRPSLRSAAIFGARWGIGHSVAVLAAGGVLLASGLRLPERFDAYGEMAVGAMLVAIGIWAFASARKLHLHPPSEHGDHAHLHVHSGPGHPHVHPHGGHPVPTSRPPDPHAAGEEHVHGHSGLPTAGPHQATGHAHEHGHGITLVGLMHGLAGTSGVVVLVPVTLMQSTPFGLAYLAAFGIGVTGAMTCYAMLAAAAIGGATRRSLELGRSIAMAAGAGGVAVGAWWVVRAAQALVGGAS